MSRVRNGSLSLSAPYFGGRCCHPAPNPGVGSDSPPRIKFASTSLTWRAPERLPLLSESVAATWGPAASAGSPDVRGGSLASRLCHALPPRPPYSALPSLRSPDSVATGVPRAAPSFCARLPVPHAGIALERARLAPASCRAGPPGLSRDGFPFSFRFSVTSSLKTPRRAPSAAPAKCLFCPSWRSASEVTRFISCSSPYHLSVRVGVPNA